MFRQFIKHTIRGFLILLPFLVIFAFFKSMFLFVNDSIIEAPWYVVLIGFFVLLFPVGLLFSRPITRGFARFFLRQVGRNPRTQFLHNMVSSVLKKIVTEEKIFQNPVWIIDSDTCERRIGFMTQESLEQFGLTDHVCVFVPDAFSLRGTMTIIPRKDTAFIEKNREQAFALAISAGLIMPSESPRESEDLV